MQAEAVLITHISHGITLYSTAMSNNEIIKQRRLGLTARLLTMYGAVCRLSFVRHQQFGNWSGFLGPGLEVALLGSPAEDCRYGNKRVGKHRW
jgi:hypothetical protein